MLKKILIALVLTTGIAYAQQQPDPAFMQHAIIALQTQRNNALDSQTVAEAKLAGLSEDLAKANAKIKELEAKLVELEKK